MRPARYFGWWIALAGVSAISSAGTASACGSLPLPSFGFAPQQPDASAQALPRNASIVLHTTCSISHDEAPIVQAASCQLTPLGSSVSLRPATGGADVPGRLVVRPDALIFVPTAPLAANSDYTLTAVLGSLGSTAPDATFSTPLHTSDAMLSPFASAVPPSVVSEWYDAPVTQCDDAKLVGKAALDALAPSICPSFHNNCHPAGTQRTLRMHGNFGPLTGGSNALLYTGQLKLSSGGLSGFEGDEGAAPASPPENTMPPPAGIVLSAAYATAPAPSSIDLFVDLLAPDDQKAQLCVRARAFDAAGQVLYAPDTCKTYVGWMTDAEWAAEAASEASKPDAAAPVAQQADGGSASAPGVLGGVDAGLAPGSPDDGCGLRPAARTSGTGAFAWLCVSLGVLLQRRRRLGAVTPTRAAQAAEAPRPVAQTLPLARSAK